MIQPAASGRTHVRTYEIHSLYTMYLFLCKEEREELSGWDVWFAYCIKLSFFLPVVSFCESRKCLLKFVFWRFPKASSFREDKMFESVCWYYNQTSCFCASYVILQGKKTQKKVEKDVCTYARTYWFKEKSKKPFNSGMAALTTNKLKLKGSLSR